MTDKEKILKLLEKSIDKKTNEKNKKFLLNYGKKQNTTI